MRLFRSTLTWALRWADRVLGRPQHEDGPDPALRLPAAPTAISRVEERMAWVCQLPDRNGLCGRPVRPGRLCRRFECMEEVWRLREVAVREDRKRRERQQDTAGSVVSIKRRRA